MIEEFYKYDGIDNGLHVLKLKLENHGYELSEENKVFARHAFISIFQDRIGPVKLKIMDVSDKLYMEVDANNGNHGVFVFDLVNI